SYNELEGISGASGSEVISKATGLIGKNQHGRIQNLTGYFDPKVYDDFGGAIGFLTSFQTNLLIRPTTDIDVQSVLDSGISIGAAKSYFHKRLSLGINIHMLYRMGVDKVIPAIDILSGRSLKPREYAGQGIGFDADFGGYYQIPWEPRFMRLNVGGSINGLLQSNFNTMSGEIIDGVKTAPPRQDRTVNLGLRADFPDSKILAAPLIALEVQNLGSINKRYSFLKRLHFGGEARVSRRVALRTGLYQGYPSGGVGINLPVVKLDFATYVEELGGVAAEWPDRRYLFRIAAELL
ncbi:MAG TPA: hypothetical protein PLH57_06895, partial [Oligoflexia bacterium]|nr:hypothetical protein [Oligoflexia bacterium]